MIHTQTVTPIITADWPTILLVSVCDDSNGKFITVGSNEGDWLSKKLIKAFGRTVTWLNLLTPRANAVELSINLNSPLAIDVFKFDRKRL